MKTPMEMFQENLRSMLEERKAMVPILAAVARDKRRHELALAHASAPVVNVKIVRYDG